MKFNRENYELYVINFLEGELSEEDHILFNKFLQDHPDINEEIKSIQNVQLQPGDEYFPARNMLKKNIKTLKYQDDFNNYCIAYLEGDLESTEKINFENWISKNPEKAHELELFRKVYLKADKSIIFNQKSKLKRRSVVQKSIRLVSILTAAAAAIIFLIIFIKPVDLINRNVISDDSHKDSKLTPENETIIKVMEQKSSTDKIAETELDNTQIKKQVIHTNKKNTSTDNSNTDINKSIKHEAGSIEKFLIEPVPPLLAHVEINCSVNNIKLRQPHPEKVRKFDEYQTLGEYVNKNVLNNFFSMNESDKHNKITFWNLALNGMEGINNMTDGGYSLNKEINKNGTLKRISLETPLLGISIPVKNKQPQ